MWYKLYGIRTHAKLVKPAYKEIHLAPLLTELNRNNAFESSQCVHAMTAGFSSGTYVWIMCKLILPEPR